MIPASLSAAIQSAADALYVPWLVILLFGSGLFLTVRFGVVQVRRFREALGTFVASQDASCLADQALCSGSGPTGLWPPR